MSSARLLCPLPLLFCFAALLNLASLAPAAETVVLDNHLVQRQLSFDGQVWHTTRFSRAVGADALAIQSDEFHLLFFDDSALTVKDFVASGKPEVSSDQRQTKIVVHYQRLPNRSYPKDAPLACAITYFAKSGEPYLRKEIEFDFPPHAQVDRLEVERFSVREKAERGGRGEPVFVDGRWFFGLEYPAGYSRHTDGNTPAADTHHYEKVGNYSSVNLEGRDREPSPRLGLLRLMHFPGFAKETTPGHWTLRSKTAVAGIGKPGDPMELAFLDYLATIARRPRSFTHYNNWFDAAGKDLRSNSLVQVHAQFRQALAPYHVRLDAMVPDNGWQNTSSLWQPSARQFPEGMAGLKQLSDALRAADTSLGLWLALDSTTCNIKWGEQTGYARAIPNSYFKQYFAHYSLSHPKYHADLIAQLRRLVKECRITYFKHDFNHLSDIGEGNGHPPTDRHGHEANVDAMLDMLEAAMEENPDIYLNLTNWIWHSPWWLQWGNALWLLAGDDGLNGNWPELSSRAMATTDRDAFIWRMWGDSTDRPLVPVSRLMTHGIIRNKRGQAESPQDTLQDWADYVMMYYGRGVQMKEWYISPAAMNPDYWRVLGSIHSWAQSHFTALANNVFVGGRPDEGNPYGFVGWDGDHGILVARNPSIASKKLRVPFDATTWYRGKPGQSFHARVVYPYQDNWPQPFCSGQAMEIELSGYATMAFEFSPGTAAAALPIPPAPAFTTESRSSGIHAAVTIPAETMPRCELVVIGYNQLPILKLNGETLTACRTNVGTVNKFASYARHGMPSAKARRWRIAAFDLAKCQGQKVQLELLPAASAEPTRNTIEAWLLLERPVKAPALSSDLPLPWPPGQSTRRQTIQLLGETLLNHSAAN